MWKIKFILLFLAFFIFPGFCWALDIDALKVDLLQGNYRRVVFEGQAELERMHLGNTDELNYILGLSYLKDSKLEQARDCFLRILKNSNSRFKKEADLGIADTYLLAGKFQKAQELYEQLIVSDTANRQKPAIFYRLSQIEYKRGNRQKANEYWLKLKTDFPLSPELRSTGGIWLPNVSVKDPGVCSISSPGLYSIQLGFFTNSANANNLKNRLLNRNYPAYLESSADGYRVKVGRFKSEKEALDLESKLSREGFNTKICP